MMTLKQILHTALWVFVAYLLISNIPQSMSGARQTLRESGKVYWTSIYDSDTIVYSPNQRVITKVELDALSSLSREYVIIIK